MSDGTLGVTSSHVRQLSDGQSTAMTSIQSNAKVTDGVAASMFVNHGPICLASITALGMANDARAAACAAMASVSQDMAKKLDVTASQYDQTDAEAAAKIDKEMHPR
ncbi:ESX-1 secretion-associated protein [Mycolicibacterium boenickei]|uniref:ESX-1 secretion-associated protein n=1 Tax=Mycolicibacterium boenickei TaxID=146017 RepID=A0AAX2ZX00_9MYCO|nr:type VII secretion target [Mycolicibacterium boenickei]UNB99942.1 ESX-1 secretion-associated protein [Mycolicibacterium boenickei]BBX89631.1 ESX-1 secretion-associated protein [Mycolicibacterium boenickei]